MNLHITAIYEAGILKPSVPLPVADGTKVDVIVVGPQEQPSKSPAAVLAAIAAMPTEPGPAFSGRDHDRILYAHP
jgi:predicted DNA-binding antitoxin AbrB/MazE fold protein